MLLKQINSIKNLPFTVLVIILTSNYTQAVPINHSKYSKAASSLGLNGIPAITNEQHEASNKEKSLVVSAEEQQEALLKIFYYAGYFERKSLWKTIDHMGFKNPEQIFNSLLSVLEKSGALQENSSKFDASFVRENLFNDSDVSDTDVIEFIVYLGQSAFGRNQGEERHDLHHQDWMEYYENEYYEAATKLGIAKRLLPKEKEYDIIWGLGASRFTMWKRLVDFKTFYMNRISVKYKIEWLTGERFIYAELDGVSKHASKILTHVFKESLNIDDQTFPIENKEEAIEEGKGYMLSLAEENKIPLINQMDRFRIYKEGDKEIPVGFSTGRYYLNYQNPENDGLTETDVAKDLIKKIGLEESIGILTSKKAINGGRPTTEKTVQDAVLELLNEVNEGKYGGQTKFKILIISDQPYASRQLITARRIIKKVLEEKKSDILIELESVGCSASHNIPKTHSELGGLILELYLAAIDNNKIKPIRGRNKLEYTTRNK